MSEIHSYINEYIIAPIVQVAGNDGEQLGTMSAKDALLLAQSKKLDLVQITYKSDPIVCRIMDYNKFLGEKSIPRKTKNPGFKIKKGAE